MPVHDSLSLLLKICDTLQRCWHSWIRSERRATGWLSVPAATCDGLKVQRPVKAALWLCVVAHVLCRLWLPNSGVALMNSRESRYTRQQKQIEDLEARPRATVVLLETIGCHFLHYLLLTYPHTHPPPRHVLLLRQREVRELRMSEAAAKALLQAERQQAAGSQGQLEVGAPCLDDRPLVVAFTQRECCVCTSGCAHVCMCSDDC